MNPDALIDRLIAAEGGYVANPADRGGPTNFGITEQTARAHGYGGDMAQLPRAAAVAIYRSIYWEAPHFAEVSLRYPAVAAELLDIGANMGPKRAAKMLQRVLNVLNRGASEYPDVPVDGDFGMLSLHALDSFRQRRGADGERVLLSGLACLRGCGYIEIAEADPSQEVFEYGWLGRNEQVAREAAQ